MIINYLNKTWQEAWKGPPLNHAYPRAFDARASFLNDARIPAQDSRALNANLTRARHF